MRAVIFEDDSTYNFGPLTLTRASFELKIGIFSFEERINRFLRVDRMDFLARGYIADHIRENRKVKANEPEAIDDEALFINGLLIFNQELLTLAKSMKQGTGIFTEDRLVMAKFGEHKAREVARLLMNAPDHESLKLMESAISEKKFYDGNGLIRNCWELISRNARQIVEDIKLMPKKSIEEISPKATVLGKKQNLYVGKDSVIDPYVVLDNTKGPIYIGGGTHIYANSWIQGPAYIGSKTIVHPSSVIREGSSIGDVCRVAGEIEESIIHGYANKQHVGFLGHAYVGEWVNLGALTTNSDLKNDYSTVDVYVRGRFVDSGELKLGCFIGDHSRTGIGCQISTGAVIGVMSNILASGEPIPKFIPSFCWYFRGKFSKGWGLKSMIETERVVMSRRGVNLTEADIKLFKRLYEITEEEREKAIKRSRAKFKQREV